MKDSDLAIIRLLQLDNKAIWEKLEKIEKLLEI